MPQHTLLIYGCMQEVAKYERSIRVTPIHNSIVNSYGICHLFYNVTLKQRRSLFIELQQIRTCQHLPPKNMALTNIFAMFYAMFYAMRCLHKQVFAYCLSHESKHASLSVNVFVTGKLANFFHLH